MNVWFELGCAAAPADPALDLWQARQLQLVGWVTAPSRIRVDPRPTRQPQLVGCATAPSRIRVDPRPTRQLEGCAAAPLVDPLLTRQLTMSCAGSLKKVSPLNIWCRLTLFSQHVQCRTGSSRHCGDVYSYGPGAGDLRMRRRQGFSPSWPVRGNAVSIIFVR